MGRLPGPQINARDEEMVSSAFGTPFKRAIIDRRLAPREIEMLCERFGIGPNRQRVTFAEMALRHGIRQGRCMQIVHKAMRQLRHPLMRAQLGGLLP